MKRRPTRAASPATPPKAELLARIAELEERLGAVTRALAARDGEARTLAHELAEARDQQTATGEILQIISTSPRRLRPVLDAIAERAARLCDAWNGTIVLADAGVLRMEAHHGPIAEQIGMVLPTDRGSVSGCAFVEGRPVHVDDLTVAEEFPLGRRIALRFGVRTILAVPLVRESVPIGVILIRRHEVRRFSDKQITIENVRLFTELEARNRELTTALDTQTATSDILRVISRSQTDVQPVFDAIVQSAVRLLQADAGSLLRVVADQIELATLTSTDEAGDAATRAAFPVAHRSEAASARAIRDRVPINIADYQTDSRQAEDRRAAARVRGRRNVVVVPLLRHDEAIGAIAVTRREPGSFTDDEVALLQTFADQAVIAIENARLDRAQYDRRAGDAARRGRRGHHLRIRRRA